MLELINSNGVLFSGIFGVISALIAAAVALWIDSQKNKRESVKGLKRELTEIKKELQSAQEKLSQYQNIEKQENEIDKSDGAIYRETLPNGGGREICAFCWEQKHIKIPILPESREAEYTHERYRVATCPVCGANCYSTSIFPELKVIDDMDDLDILIEE